MPVGIEIHMRMNWQDAKRATVEKNCKGWRVRERVLVEGKEGFGDLEAFENLKTFEDSKAFEDWLQSSEDLKAFKDLEAFQDLEVLFVQDCAG
jgi:hypothetical protein